MFFSSEFGRCLNQLSTKNNHWKLTPLESAHSWVTRLTRRRDYYPQSWRDCDRRKDQQKVLIECSSVKTNPVTHQVFIYWRHVKHHHARSKGKQGPNAMWGKEKNETVGKMCHCTHDLKVSNSVSPGWMIAFPVSYPKAGEKNWEEVSYPDMFGYISCMEIKTFSNWAHDNNLKS